MLSHGKRHLIDGDDMETMVMVDLSSLVKCSNHVVIKPPHGARCRINNEHSNNDPTKEQVSEIPSVN